MELENIKREFVNKFKSEGSEKFYKFLLFCAINKLTKDSDEKINVSLEYLCQRRKLVIVEYL